MQTYLLSKELVVNPETIKSTYVVRYLQVALSQFLDVLAGFGQDSSFTLKQKGGDCDYYVIIFTLWKITMIFVKMMFQSHKPLLD